jgi:Predicted secreted protein
VVLIEISGIFPLSAIAKFMGNLKLDDAISKITGGKHTASADLKLKTPKLAENGSQVPVTVDATAPPGVKSVFLIVHENLKPVAMRVDFESADVAAFASFRVKMGKPTKVTAIAHTANGFVTANGSTKVTKGGC